MELLRTLQLLLQLLGNVTLEDAVTWARVKENAERLRAEGHELPEEPEDVPEDVPEGSEG